MNWKFWQKPKPAPTRPGCAIGFRPERPGFIIQQYNGCGHSIRFPSNIKTPFMCPHESHNGWGS